MLLAVEVERVQLAVREQYQSVAQALMV